MGVRSFEVRKKFLDDTSVVLLSYSVTPWIDSVAKLNSYATSHQISAKQWHLLTGDKNMIYNLARKSYFAEEQIRGIYNATLQLDIQQLIADIKELEQE